MRTQRIFAYIIDVIIIGILSGILCSIVGLEVKTLWSSAEGVRVIYNPVSLVGLAISALYFLTDVMTEGSPGKKLLGLRVIPPSPEKDMFSTAATRALVKVISIHLFIGVILFFLMDPSLHDRLAGTTVNKKAALA